MNLSVKFSTLLFCFLLFQTVDAQIYLQLEKANDPISKKFARGSIMDIKTKSDQENWIRISLSDVLYPEQLIVFNNGFEKIEDITHIRLYNNWAKHLGEQISRFSIAWILYGGVANVAFDSEFGTPEIIIGVAAFLTGWMIKKFWYKKTYSMGNVHRLRIVDLNFPAPRG